MKEVTRFKCDVCGKEHDTEEAARKCEALHARSYRCFTLKFTPSTGKFELVCNEFEGEPQRKDEVLKVVTQTDDGYEVIIWNVSVSGTDPDELVKSTLAKTARSYLEAALSELDSLLKLYE